MKFLKTNNDQQIPAIGLGTWEISRETAASAVRTAIESGYRHIDCAMIYLNEPWVGEGIQSAIADGVVTRDELWITSKLWNNSHRADRVRPAIEKTLTDLKLDHLDLYLIHWPVALKEDVLRPESGADFLSLKEIPLWETWQAMEEVCAAGLTRSIGVSNFSAKKIDSILEQGKIKPVVNQVEAHPYFPQTKLKQYCDQNGILLTGYSPLGSAGRPERLIKESDPVLLQDPVVAEIASARSVTPAQILLAWAVNRDTIAIPKSANADRQRQNLAAADINLSDDELDTLAGIDRNSRFLDGTFWEMEGGPYTVANLWDE